MNWLFEPGGRVRRGGSAAAYAFRPDLNVFVREVVQNAKDQKRPDAKVAKVHFRLMVLRNRSLQRFLDALQWGELQGHIRAAADQIQQAAFLRRAIENLEERAELLLLRVDRPWLVRRRSRSSFGAQRKADPVPRATGAVARPSRLGVLPRNGIPQVFHLSSQLTESARPGSTPV